MTAQSKQGMGRGTFLLASVACLVLLQLCFVASNVGANMLPKTALQERAEASWASPLLTNIYRYDTSIATIPVCYDNNRFIIEVAQQRSWDDPLTTSVRASIADRSPEGVDVPFDYFRYWHGWQMLCDLGLLAGGIGAIQAIVLTLLAVSIIWLTVALNASVGLPAAITFSAAAFIPTGLGITFMTDLTLGISLSAGIFTSALLVTVGHLKRQDEPYSTRRLLSLIALGGGAVYCFLDFLTIPAAVLAMVVFCGTIACRRQDSTIRWHLSTIACITIAFGVGFLATWMFKWVLAAIVIGPEYVVGNVIGEMNIWTSEHGELPQPDWASWLKSLYSLSPQLFALLAPLGYMTLSSPLLAAAILTAVALLVYELATSRKGRRAMGNHARPMQAISWKELFTLAIPMAYIPLYTLVMSSHAIVHIPVFSSRIWSVFFAIALCLLVWRLAPSSRGRAAAVSSICRDTVGQS